MPIELTKNGFADINRHIDQIEDKVTRGLLNPSYAPRYLMDVRAEVYGLRKALRDVLVIVNDTAGPDGSSVA